MRSTTLLTLLLLTFYVVTSANNDPITIQLENANARHMVSLENTTQVVELCQLEEGQTYLLRSISQSSENVLIQNEEGASTEFLFAADGDCKKIVLEKEGNIRAAVETVLSISCMTCMPELNSRFPNLSVSGGASALELIQDVFIGGDCFEIQNAAFVGNPNGIGTFANGGTSIGLDNGVIISSGNITNAPGPNNSGGAGNNMGGGSHPDLAELASAPIFDATGITFQFKPTVPQIFFNYVFASEEYCEYVGAGFNDVFGFFISGPGISGGFLLSGENIAVIPGTSTAVAIDEVNHVSNTSYFVGNSGTCGSTFNMDDIQFDGFTQTLTAVANVQPCETYFIRLLVGDAGDGIFDSAVFLEANSFNAGGASAGEAISPTTGSNITYEACSDGYFVLQAAGDINTDREIEFSIAPFGTATPGVDYVPFGTSVTVPAGQTEVIIPITVIPDDLIEGQETIVLELQNSCSCSGTYIELIIEDVPPLEVSAFDIELCDGLPGELNALAFGGLPGYSYSWLNTSSGETFSGESIPVSPSETTTYSVSVTDECGQLASSNATVIVNPPSSAQMVGGGQFCGTDISTDIVITFGGIGPWLFSYSLNGEFQEPILTSENPYTLSVSEPGFYFPESVISVESFCEGEVIGLAFVEVSDFDIEVESDNISCPGEDDGSITATAMNGVTPYGYTWENVSAGTPIANSSSDLNDLPAGIYSVTVNDNGGCLDSMEVEIIEPEPLEAIAAVASVPNCDDSSGGSIDLTLNGGTPNYQFVWSNGDTMQNPVNLIAGTYGVIVTDDGGCMDSTSIVVTEDIEAPLVSAAVDDIINCYLPEIDLDGSGSSEGAIFEADWTGPGLVSGDNTLNPTVNQAGEYILLVTNTDNGCTSADTVMVDADQIAPEAIAEDNILNCYQQGVMPNTEGTSTGSEYTYEWSGPGIAGSTMVIDPLIYSPGDYTMLVTNTDNGCQDSVSITIDQNIAEPAIGAGESSELNCQETEIMLTGTATGNQADFVYSWTTDGGNIISGENTLTPLVDAAGIYELEVVDTLNGCSSTAAVEILQDPSTPIAIINGEAPLNCDVTSIQLDATNSNLGTNGIYNWITSDGNIVSGGNTLSPVIDQPGTYQLIILGGGNVCEDTATVVIPIDTLQPALTPAPAVTLTCDITSLDITAQVTTSSGQSEISWYGPSGMTIISPDSLTINVTNPGQYNLVVTDPVNGCLSSIASTVLEDVQLPEVVVDDPAIITCSSPAIDLDAGASSAGANFVYEWQAPDGSVLAETTAMLSQISEPGTYTLSIENTDNGCMHSTQVMVEENINYPIVGIASADILNCYNPSFNLIGDATSTASTLLYQWSTLDGNIVSGGTSLTPVIDEPGDYVLVVTDESNDCITMDTVSVQQDIEAPSADAGQGTTLTCSQTSFTLSGTATANGPILTEWSTADGNILSGANTLTPEVDNEGTYTLLVTNQVNGCTFSSDVIITANNSLPTVAIDDPEILDCLTSEVSLDASNSDSGTNYVYQWSTTSGNIIGNINAAIVNADAVGTYTLQITNTDNDCVDQAFVIVDQDIEPPVAAAGVVDTINCYSPSIELDGSASSQGTNFTYEWSTSNGSILSGSNSLSPSINAPGTYELLVTNLTNNCTSDSQVDIIEDMDNPVAAAADPETLTCTLTETDIDATASSQGNEFAYEWTTTNGNILDGTNGLTPMVDAPGMYELEVMNSRNGCSDLAAVLVEENIQLPLAEAGESPVLTCADVTVPLDATASSQGTYSYQWDGPGLISGPTGLTPVVDEPGMYTIFVTDLTNNCVSEDIVEVLQDITNPAIAIETPAVLDCALEEQELDASNSSQGMHFEYSWTAASIGNIVQGAQSVNPVIDEPGVYTLTILNTNNGCSETQSITVNQDITIPEVGAAEPAIITCSVPNITIDGTASSTGTEYAYEWTTNDGNILMGANSLLPVVDEGGTYELLITNNINNCINLLTVDVIKDVEEPVAEAGTSQILNCTVESLYLDATASSAGDFSYQWEGPGLLNGQNTTTPEVGEPGIYTLIVTNNFNGCESEDIVQINQDIAQPTAIIDAPAILNCELEEQNLDGTATNQGAIFEYEWTANAIGNIISGEHTLTPLIDQPGTYTLFVLNTENGCTDTEVIVVEQDIAIPGVGAAEPAIITCVVPEIEINATASSTGNEFAYQWTTADGNILSGSNSLTPMVDEGGTYELLITNNINHCTNLLVVEVEKDIEQPIAEAGETQELNCDIPSVTLNGGNSSQGDFSYQWEGPGLEDITTITTEVEDPGTYTIYVTNNFNGCVSIDEVVITQDVAVPVVIIDSPEILTCAVESIILDATASSQGATLIYQWTTPNGHIIEGIDGMTPLVDEPGDYTLTIINTTNQCENDTDISVVQDIETPTAEAGSDYLMDCWEPTDELNGVGSSVGTDYVYEWSTTSGNIVNGANTLDPVIAAPGIYTILVTDITNGCTDEDDIFVSQTIPIASPEAVQPPCHDDPGHIFIPEIIGGTSPFVYSIDGGGEFYSNSSFTNLDPGIYDVVVQDVNGCEHETEITIDQPDSMIVLITLDEVELLLGEQHQIVAQVNIPEEEIGQIIWSNAENLSCDDCLTPMVTPIYTADYRVDVISVNGCHDEAFLRIFVDRERDVYIPNVFSPNGDGANDFFYPFARPNTVEKIKSFMVFNRWGEPVHEVYNFAPNDPIFGWDGHFRGELMNGAVFTWFAEIEFVDGDVEIFEGDVLLLR
ncbi:MAG: choice-of-anchor L domain-containing protein [Chitinophagales bacterium]|nr:choice-of-anchor L domain-containing protein [Chitinophagales bacterium]